MPHVKKITLYLTLLLLGGGLLAPLVSYATLTLDSTSLTSDGALTVKSASSSLTLIGETNQTGAITVASSSETLILNLGTGTGATTINIATGATNAKTVNIATGADLVNVITLGVASTTLSIGASSTFGGALGLSSLATNSPIYLNSSGVITTLASSTAGNVLTATSTAPYFSWETAASIPAGTLAMYASSTAPSGWLLANGSAVSRTTYADLFAAIGTTYGVGDGSTTFNVPDFIGRVPVGLSASGPALINALGDNDGVTANSRNISHRHQITQSYAGSGGTGGWGGTVSNSSIQTTTGDTNNTDYPAFLVVNYIIKT